MSLCCVLEQDIVLVQPRKTGKCPNMTENCSYFSTKIYVVGLIEMGLMST